MEEKMQQENRGRQAVEELTMQPLWNYFYELSQIPRESGNEENVRQFLLDFAKKEGFEAVTDKTGNVILRTRATKGYEQIPSLALQAHMDMVCVQAEGTEHDFSKDPIILRRQDDWLSAEGTTLGADNGIGIALILDLFTDPEAQHGPLEAVFTVSEETGLFGALGLDASLIQSRLLINLDSEEEGVFFIGCAGGIEVHGSIPRQEEAPFFDVQLWEAVVDGLRGGHSGGDIDKQRANAIQCMARYLHALQADGELYLVSITGGTKRNVIPHFCKALFFMPKSRSEDVVSLASAIEQQFKEEFQYSDPSIRLCVSQMQDCGGASSSALQTQRVINALFLCFHGVERMSHAIPGLVETSSNLALVKTTAASYEIVTSHRSTMLSCRDYVARRAMAALQTAQAVCSLENPYPAWTPAPNSPLANLCGRSWQEFTGEPATITAIHAGLECGIINSLVEGMDSISFGPTIKDAHATSERLSISSTVRIAAFLRYLCKKLA